MVQSQLTYSNLIDLTDSLWLKVLPKPFVSFDEGGFLTGAITTTGLDFDAEVGKTRSSGSPDMLSTPA